MRGTKQSHEKETTPFDEIASPQTQTQYPHTRNDVRFKVPLTSRTSTPLERHSERKRRISHLKNAPAKRTKKMFSLNSGDVSLNAQQDVPFLRSVRLNERNPSTLPPLRLPGMWHSRPRD